MAKHIATSTNAELAALVAAQSSTWDGAALLALGELKRRAQLATSGGYDIWISHDDLRPVARAWTEERARLVCRGLNAWDNAVGGEFMTWYTPAGKTAPRMYPPASEPGEAILLDAPTGGA